MQYDGSARLLVIPERARTRRQIGQARHVRGVPGRSDELLVVV
jgi:hypothetical protein